MFVVWALWAALGFWVVAEGGRLGFLYFVVLSMPMCIGFAMRNIATNREAALRDGLFDEATGGTERHPLGDTGDPKDPACESGPAA